MDKSVSILILCINIRASSQVLFNCFNVSLIGSNEN